MTTVRLTTKGDLINDAFSKIGVSGITAPTTADDIGRGLSRLEGTMYQLEEARNICVNYNFTADPKTSDSHGMPLGTTDSVSSILALRLLSDYNIPASNELAAQSSAAISTLSSFTAQVRPTQYPRRMARGGGNTLRWNRWQKYYREEPEVPQDCASIYINVDEVNDYTETWTGYLIGTETISSATVEVTSGLTLVSSSVTSPEVDFRLQAMNPQNNGYETVTITVTTSTGRVNKRVIGVQITEPNPYNPRRY